MNKLLEKCAAQSLIQVNGEMTFSKERFAELIIGECCVALDAEINRDVAVDLIREHFGV